MAWLFAIVVLLLVVFIPGFRSFAIGLLILAIIVGLGIWAYHNWSESRAAKLISPSEITLEDMRLGTSNYGSWSLSGRIRNNSQQYTLRRLKLDLIVQDCTELAPLPTNCDIVGQTEETIYLEVPPGQVRSISESVYFSSNTKVLRKMAWQYNLIGIKGE